MKIYISPGNTKLGKIPNISLLPVDTCLPGAECIRRCYARKSLMYPSVKNAWESNTRAYFEDYSEYFLQVSDWVKKNKPEYFRWHVGGDCPDSGYLTGMDWVSSRSPDTKFMMFTKKLDIVRGFVTHSNLNIILSMWPYMATGTEDRMRAWVQGHPGTPKDAVLCSGKCEDCLHCWVPGGKDILLRSH